MLLADYQKLEHNEQPIRSNSDVSRVKGKGKVTLKRTFGKKLTLNKVLHISDICKNLISESILSEKGFE